LRIIRRIREKVLRQEYEFTIPHFFEQMAEDDLILADVASAIASGRIGVDLLETQEALDMRLWVPLRMGEKLP
jgi:hypothetical protein